MKKISVIAAIAASLFVATPAVALEVPTQQAWLDITPCDLDCLYAATVDATDGSQLDSLLQTGLSENFCMSSWSSELDPETGDAYFMLPCGTIYEFNINTEDGLDLLSDVGGLPTIDAEGIGLSIDDATGILYLMYNDPDAGHFYVVSVDRDNGALGTPLEMPTALNDAGAYDFAIMDGIIYVLTDVNQISKFNLSDGSPAGAITYPEFTWIDLWTIDASANGVLRMVSRNADDGDEFFLAYDTTSSEWADPIDSGDSFDAMTWYGTASPAALAETGTDATGALAGSVALLALGGALALRRRARR